MSNILFYAFHQPLQEGMILSRPNRFIFHVLLNGEKVECHCPSTGRIGQLHLEGLPCLLSYHPDPKRRTAYTVEAIGLHRPEEALPQWVGINQNAMNRYVEFFLQNHSFSKMLPAAEVRREQRSGKSRLDFRVGDVFLEVKMPLQHLYCPLSAHLRLKKTQDLGFAPRLTRHLDALGESASAQQRALMLLCFAYDGALFQPQQESRRSNSAIAQSVEQNRARGLEFWQVNFAINAEGVRLLRYFPWTG